MGSTLTRGRGCLTTVPDQIVKLWQKFGLTRIVLVGDRGMLTQTQIDTLRTYPGLGWVSASRSEAISELIAKGLLKQEVFEPEPLAEITSPDFPGERLIACYNDALAKKRKEGYSPGQAVSSRREYLSRSRYRARRLIPRARAACTLLPPASSRTAWTWRRST